MSYKIKTLIVFDTNSLRSMEAGDIAYSSFSFGKPYVTIEQFVKANKLEADVTLAVPEMVIEELKQQKQRSYQKDIQDLKKIIKRLTGLPHIGADDLKIPDEYFSCADFIEGKAREYLKANAVNLLVMQDEHAPSMLKSMLAKVIGAFEKEDKPKSPFAHSGKFRDAGFKDSLIWETLMHFESVKDFDKVIFLTRDGDYKENCIDDFQTKWERHIEIEKDENRVVAKLNEDYGNYIKHRKIYDYAQKDYFDDYLRDLLTPATYVEVEGESLKIENYAIKNHCANVENVADEEGDFISPVIHSEVIIYTTRDGEKAEIPISAKTVLTDAEYMEIEETTFYPSIN